MGKFYWHILIFVGCGFFVVFSAAGYADVGGERRLLIEEVTVAGNRILSDEQILSKVRSRVGEYFDPARAAEDARRIAELKGVDRSYYSTSREGDRIRLMFVVVERAVINDVVFEGNHDWSAKSLSGKLHFKKGQHLEPVMVEIGRRSLLEFYYEKGYAFAEIEVDKSGLQRGVLIYRITEGPRVRISAVKFSGNKALKGSALKKVLKTKRKKFFIWSRYYVESTVQADVGRLQQIYRQRGYLDAQVRCEPYFSKNSDSVKVVFLIDEGIVYRIDEVVVTGGGHFGRQELLEQIRSQKGRVYIEKIAQADAGRLVKLYAENGFVDANVVHRRQFVRQGLVKVVFEVKSGERFRIGRIDITGNEQTQDKVVRRVLDEYDFKPGRWYNGEAAKGDGTGSLEKTVKATVMAGSATIRPYGQKPGQKDALVSIVEGQTGMVMIGAGVASDSGVIGQFVFEQRNFDIGDWPESFTDFITAKAFKGAGQSLRIALQPGTEVSEYSASFTEPYLQDKPVSLDVVGTSYERIMECYDEGRGRGYVGLEKRFRDKWRRSIGFRVEDVDVTGIDIDAPREIKDEKGGNFISGARFGIGRDMTDDRYNPTEGFSFNAGYEQVVGDHEFGILSGTFRRYKTLYQDLAERKTVLAAKLHIATTLGDAPFFEKFYGGGQNSIRGFDYRGVSPRGLPTGGSLEAEDPVGSDWIFLAGAEVTVPLVSETMAMLFFADSGTVETGPYRVAVGTGIQILIPQWFGPVPMRFEFAAPLIKDDRDDTQVFSFSVGRLF